MRRSKERAAFCNRQGIAQCLKPLPSDLDIAGPESTMEGGGLKPPQTGNTNNNKNVREISGRPSAPFFSFVPFSFQSILRMNKVVLNYRRTRSLPVF